MKTRLVALALTLCMLFTLTPTALAADGETADRPLYYKYSGTENALTNEPMEYEGPTTSFWQFYTDAAGQQEVRSGLVFEPDEGTAENAVELYTDTGDYGTEWRVSARAIGTGKLVYTDGSGVRYSVAFACLLPDSGFSSSTELTKETYLVYGRASFVVGVPFYYVFPAGTNILSAVVDQCYTDGDVLSVEVLPDQPNVCKLTVTAAGNTSGSHRFRVAFTLPDESSPTDTRVYKELMSLQDATPYFGFRQVRWSSGKPDGFRNSFYSQLNARLNSGYTAGFFLGETERTVTSIEFVPAKGTDADAVTAARNSEYRQYWDLDCVKLGSGTLVCETADGPYELPVTVSLPNTAFFTEQRYAGDTYISDSFLYDTYKTENAFWLIREQGFTADDLGALTFSCDTWDENGRQTLAFADYLSWKHVSRSDGTEDAPRYDLQFTFVDDVRIPKNGIDLRVELKDDFSTSLQIMDIAATVIRKTGPSAITASVGGADYTVGFGFVDRSGAVTLNTDGRWSQSYTLSPEAGDSADTPYRSTREETSWGILAASGTASSYTPASDDVQKKITVERVWLERRSGSCGEDGNTNTFSFSPNERQLELTEGLTAGGFPIYVADEVGEAYLCAAINVDGTSGTVYMRLVYRKQKVASETFGSIDDLNNWLTKNVDAIHAAAMDTSSDTTWNLTLPNGSYSGTITIPKELSDTNGNSLGIAIWGNPSTLNGSINLNGAKIDTISHLNFTSQGKTDTAIQNGSAVVDNCTFTGYKAALSGVLFPHNCTFTNNETALVLDVKNARLHSDMYNCRFEGNDTAMRVASITLNDPFLSPYHLRLHDSAFLNNAVDFDVQTKGTFYFLRNYFADAVGTARQAKISTSNGAKVYADLVWTASPLTTAADARQLVLNRAATALPNDADTQATAISADALTAETQIDLANESGETVASWSGFGSVPSPQRAMRALRAASAGAADGFRPGVDIQQTSADTMRVTVADSAALQSKQPLLTIPYTLPNATVTGPNNEEIAYTRVGNNLSFRVSAGGTYTVTAALPQVEYTDGTITVKNAPADAVQAIAALYSADDQLLQTAVAQVQDGTAELPLTVQAGQNCRVFLLDQGNKPVCSTIEP